MASAFSNSNKAFKHHSSPVDGCLISKDGSSLASCTNDGNIHISDLSTGTISYTAACGSAVSFIAQSEDGDRVLGVTQGGVAVLVQKGTHNTIFKGTGALHGCAFNAKKNMVALCGPNIGVVIHDSFDKVLFEWKVTAAVPQRVEFSPNGSLLAVGCANGALIIYAFARTEWLQISTSRYHQGALTSITFSRTGDYLLLTSADTKASVWKVGTTWSDWSSTPHAELVGHTALVQTGAFLGDGNHVITVSHDKTLRTWQISGGSAQKSVAMTNTPRSMSFDVVSGKVALGTDTGSIEIWNTTPYKFPHVCVRQLLNSTVSHLESVDSAFKVTEKELRQQMARERELTKSISDLETKLAQERQALATLRSTEYLAKSRDLIEFSEKKQELSLTLASCSNTMDSLMDCLVTSGLSDLRGENFKEWLCDIGLVHLTNVLQGVNGEVLTMLHIDDIVGMGVSFRDASKLLLSSFIAHSKMDCGPSFNPPNGFLLSWTVEDTANWIKRLGAPYEQLASAGWDGAALCSLSPTRIVNASNKQLSLVQATKFMAMISSKRQADDEIETIDDEWATKWSGVAQVTTQMQWNQQPEEW